jgi:hypothetical protein
MINLLLSRSSDPVGVQVLVGMMSAFLFWLFFSFFNRGRAKSGDKTDSINNIYDKIKKFDAKHSLPSKPEKVEDKVRVFLRKHLDNNCLDIVLSCQDLPDDKMFTEIGMKIFDYYENGLKKEPDYEKMRQMALSNNIDWDKILEEEYERVMDIYEDPFDYV